MNKNTYISKSLRFFQKQHLAVLLATLISAAVLTGALIVGDSVKLSLQNNVDQRLGKTTFALSTQDRFVRSELAEEISKETKSNLASVLLVQGIAINPDADRRINRTQVLGVDDKFWKFSDDKGFDIKKNEVILSEEVARELHLQTGETILLRIQNADIIPLNAPFNSDEDPSIALRLKVAGIASSEQLANFSLRNQQANTYNVFLNLDFLAEEMDLAGLSNLILAQENENIQKLEEAFQKNWTLKDAALQLRYLEQEKQFELLSDRVFIDHSIAEKVNKLALQKQDILTYFVNSLSSDQKSCPYSFVTAASDDFIGVSISDNEIIINKWLAEDLDVKIGDSLLLKYYIIGPLRTLDEQQSYFIIKDILPLETAPFTRDLMPDFPGLSSAGNCSEWDAGIPIDLKKIKDKDEDYWDDFQGTPKAIISLNMGLKLWNNLYGNYTAIRFSSQETNKEKLEDSIMGALSPLDLGFRFQNVRAEGKRAASSGVDFGELFLSLSFFVIAAAILLMVLMYRLNMESRSHEVGLLFAMGYSRKQILKLRIKESLATIILGSILGGFVGILYNQWMIAGLNGVWNQAVHADMLAVFILPQTLMIGIVVSIIISLFSIYFVIRKMLKKQAISIIQGQDEIVSVKSGKLDLWLALIGIISTVGILAYTIFQSIAQNASLMLMAGFLLLTGLTALVSFLLPKLGANNSGGFNKWKLAFINARRNKNRSIAVIALLAIGTFTIMVTGANRKTFDGSENQRSSGTGGFQFWAETTVPILQNLNTAEGREALGLFEEELFEQTSFVQFHSRNGDDASCLNLNQVQQPQILGVDAVLFDSLAAFSFATQLEESSHPWLSLQGEKEARIIPAIADQTVIQWGLMKKIGDTLTYFNEAGKSIKLVLVGGLNASVFQGNILISEEAFIDNFPSAAGSKYMMIGCGEAQAEDLKQVLNNDLSDYGMVITAAPTRLANFYSVTNTYLSIFMILGGLGVILGTIGLGIVLVRNMLERRQELDLLKAIGYDKKQILNLVLTENIALLILGIFIGLVSALIGILPSLISPAFHIPSDFLFVLLLGVFISGLFWIVVGAWRVVFGRG
ncbi:MULTISPECIES: FtsX-like permease family protein [unclassified Lentimicrobium]|uniref:FtsX-like permease family protein n=1 Tax=unclassified Lentimicrobium TaxID=2677434 RepID=UPI00155648C2|nr:MULTISPECIES: ABC transporter permease [unclassified Lentimicrobium]NPD45851.1 ABC transporter permease [Lentimicrobium sp. S6]NPD86562.1 ABC transporter permease [Lentimicrobium sp. L6]